MTLRHHLGSNSLSTGYSTWQQWSLFASQRGSSPTKAYQPCLRRWTGSREGYWQLCASVSSLYKKLLIKVLWRPVCIGLDCMKDCSQGNGNGSSKMIWLLRSFIAPSVQLERVCKLLLFVWYLAWTERIYSSVQTLRQQPAYDVDRRRGDRLDWFITLLRHLAQVSCLHDGSRHWNYAWHRYLVVWFQMLPPRTCKFMHSSPS